LRRPPPCQRARDASLTRFRPKQGRPLYGAGIKIAGEAGKELPHDGVAPGDLLTRGPWVCRGYPQRGSEGAAPNGWFATGDLATTDPNGYVEPGDRSQNVIWSAGERISSIAPGNIAVSHPDVAEAAVINARQEWWLGGLNVGDIYPLVMTGRP
jgi:non-ribosomal peptide synthetase component E (peptide arylation enzyme)